ncbi:unnamed protein product [Gordionus sp. m RMFG-2023]|uniref:synaptojanin-1-like n=1 Tax=Gordionus sp. m RMFG-2023 TaxID=3053472 RepID=UPI0030E17616
MALRNNINLYINDSTNYGAILESRQGILLFQNDSIFEIDEYFLKTLKPQYSKFYEGYSCLGLITLSFGSNLAQFIILVNNCSSIGKILDNEIYKILSTNFICINSNLQFEEEYNGISEIKKFLNSGCFYFSFNIKSKPFDLTLSAESIKQNLNTDDRFFWNKIPYSYLLQNGINNGYKWFTPIICGSIDIKTCYAGNNKAKLCLISRFSCERAGTRFNVRGIDDNGFVANFVETEQVIYLDDEIVSSFVQIRGSVPLFWEQTGIQVGAHKIQLSRGFEASRPAYERHMHLIKTLYQNIIILNLLGNKEGEKLLSETYQHLHKISSFHDIIPMVQFDYHANCRNIKNAAQNLSNLWEQNLLPSLIKLKNSHSSDYKGMFFLSHGTSEGTSKANSFDQNVVFRSNCVDCIDRTNATQTYIARKILIFQMLVLGLNEKQLFTRFDEIFRSMWVANGDKLSNIYAGTNALECKGKLKEGALSVSRTIQSNFLDDSRQLAIDLLLLNSSKTHYLDYVQTIFPVGINWVSSELIETLYYWYREITEPFTLRLFLGTWNVNGGKCLTSTDSENLSEWLTAPIYKISFKSSPIKDCDDMVPDVYIIGFQEIIDLNAKNIAISNVENQRYWETEIHNILKLKGKFVSVISAQLVGVCVFLFVNHPLVHYIKDISVTKVKTGLGGTAGNKGGICVRFTCGSESYSFVCAHLAAGQSQVRERNSDFADISSKIHPIVNNTDYLFWFGDFNYRIDMPIDNVKDYIKEKKWDHLTSAEQLTLQRHHKHAFQDFKEGFLTFAPTYKYDLFSQHYDTSDKSRIPAWTDRILWKHKSRPGFNHLDGKVDSETDVDGKNDEIDKSCRQLIYGRAELKSSDHRPVYAIFDTETRLFNPDLFESKLDSIVNAAGPLDRSVRIYLHILRNKMEMNKNADRKPPLLKVEFTHEDFSDEDLNGIYQNLYDSLTNNAGEIVWLRFDQAPLSSSLPSSFLLNLPPGLYYAYGLTCTFVKGYAAVYASQRLNLTNLLSTSGVVELVVRIRYDEINASIHQIVETSKEVREVQNHGLWREISKGELVALKNANCFMREYEDAKINQQSFMEDDIVLQHAEVIDNDIGLELDTDTNFGNVNSRGSNQNISTIKEDILVKSSALQYTSLYDDMNIKHENIWFENMFKNKLKLPPNRPPPPKFFQSLDNGKSVEPPPLLDIDFDSNSFNINHSIIPQNDNYSSNTSTFFDNHHHSPNSSDFYSLADSHINSEDIFSSSNNKIGSEIAKQFNIPSYTDKFNGFPHNFIDVVNHQQITTELNDEKCIHAHQNNDNTEKSRFYWNKNTEAQINTFDNILYSQNIDKFSNHDTNIVPKSKFYQNITNDNELKNLKNLPPLPPGRTKFGPPKL